LRAAGRFNVSTLMLPARSRNRIGEVGFGARAVWGGI
jgi:hypothetical protein